jgi:methionyl-tRNA formyltransferase
MKIGFFGDGPWACNALKLLHADSEVKIVFIALRHNSPDEALKQLGTKFGIDYVEPENINADKFLNRAAKFRADLFVSMSFDQIFKKQTLKAPPLGTINCHAGKLPFYRGRNILNWVLINDEKEFGITVHYIDEGIDTGDIILQKTYPITDKDTYATLLELAHIECAELLYDGVCLIKSGLVKSKQQHCIHPVGMYCTGRKVGDENLDWNMSSREIFNFVRAVCKPGPMARCWLGKTEVYINRVKMVPNAPVYKGIPGAVLFSESDAVFVKTGDSLIKVVEYKKDGSPLQTGNRLVI